MSFFSKALATTALALSAMVFPVMTLGQSSAISDPGSGGDLAISLIPFDCETYRSHAPCQADVPESGLLAWHETDSGLSSSGGVVTEWADKIGNNDLTPLNGEILVIAGALNGYTALQFDHGQALHNAAVAFPQGSSDRTICIAADYEAGDGGGYSYGTPNSNKYFQLGVNASSQYRILTTGEDNDDSATAAAGWAVQCVVVDSNTMTHYVNDSQIDTASVTYETDGNTLIVGYDPYRSVASMVWNRALSGSELTDVYEYLRDKYDLEGTPVIPPTAANDSTTLAQGASTTVSVLSNDSDADGTLDTGTLTLVATGNNGACTVDGTDIDYTHNDSATSFDSCTYTVDDNDGNTSNVATISFSVVLDNPGSDSEYGPRAAVVAGTTIENCPDIPDLDTLDVTTVSNASEFWAAVPGLGAGDAIVVDCTSCGTGWAGTIPESASGVYGNRSYILAENIQSAELSGFARWRVDASHITIAGFKKTGTGDLQISGDYVTGACGHLDMNGISSDSTVNVLNEYPATHDDFAYHDNTIIDGNRVFYWNAQCSYYNQAANTTCKGSNKRHHIHHNSVTAIAGGVTSARPLPYLVYMGVGWTPEDINNLSTPVSADRQEVTLENNYFKWRVNQNLKVLEIKSSGNIIRNNCFDEMGPPSIRAGNDNLVTGNWIRKAGYKKYFDDHGWGNIVAFNYYSDGANNTALDFWHGIDWLGSENNAFPYTWAYSSTYGSVYSHNVFNKYSIWIRYSDLDVFNPRPAGTSCSGSRCYNYLATGSPTFGAPEGMTIEHNKLHYSGSPNAYFASDTKGDGSYTHAQFKTLNPNYDDTTHVHSSTELDPNVACGTPGVVSAPAGTVLTHSRIKGGAQTIARPSWMGTD